LDFSSLFDNTADNNYKTAKARKSLFNNEIDEEKFDTDMDWLLEHHANNYEQNETPENCNIYN
jgi:hypothetical protein